MDSVFNVLKAAGVGLALLLAVAPAAAQAAPAGQLQVWNVNTHRMTDNSTFNYHKFIEYITTTQYLPDVVTIQEAGSPRARAGCKEFARVLETHAKAARPQAPPEDYDYDCRETRSQGGAAVVFRTSRLSLSNEQAVAVHRVATDKSCQLSPWKAQQLRLQDKKSNKYVSVLSVHLPTRQVDSKDCAWENNQLLTRESGRLGQTDMKIIAGDWNHADAATTRGTRTWIKWHCQYAGMNVDVGTCPRTGGENLGWKDAIYQLCKNQGVFGPDADIYNRCLRNHWTKNNKRIDFLFTNAHAINNQITVPQTTPWYSDHLGQGALLTYG
jgi:endonuclease/exonuclease/phosphatase family metal-dependent hydrolase